MPPAVTTEMTEELTKLKGMKMIDTEELIKQTFKSLKKGELEIKPGQSSQLPFMRRVAPNFTNRQLWNASKSLIPA